MLTMCKRSASVCVCVCIYTNIITYLLGAFNPTPPRPRRRRRGAVGCRRLICQETPKRRHRKTNYRRGPEIVCGYDVIFGESGGRVYVLAVYYDDVYIIIQYIKSRGFRRSVIIALFLFYPVDYSCALLILLFSSSLFPLYFRLRALCSWTTRG